MAAKKIGVPYDFQKNEIQNPVAQNLASAPGSPAEGQWYYDTVSDSLFVYGGASQPGGGGAAFFNYHPKSLLSLANTWTSGQTFNAAITGNNTINLTGTSGSGVGGLFTAVGLANTGMANAATATRYVGGTASAAPAAGTWVAGDYVVTAAGEIYICTSGGTPGTWQRVGTWLLGANNAWTGTNAFNNSVTGSGSISMSNTVTGTAIIASGLTGATQASRYGGATTSGAPASGTWVVGDFVVDRTGSIWICTTGGSPGTWTQVGATFTVYNQSVKANNGAAVTQRSVLNFVNGTYTTATATDVSSQTDVKFDVSTGTPSSSQTFGSSNLAGSNTTLSRSDHTHSFPAQNTFAVSGFAAAAADLGWGGFKITNLGAPSASTDAANKGYVDSVATGLDIKASVRAASTATVTVTYNATNGASARGQITAAPNTLDGVSLAANDRILLKDQSTGAQKGIWVVTTLGTGANGVWDRATDFDADAEVTSGAFVFVEEGTVNADTGWVLTTNNPIIIGGGSGTALTFSQFSGAGSWTAGAGLTQSGTTMNVGAGTGITVNADDVAIDTAVVARKYTTATHASSTSIAITHSLGNQWVTAQVIEVATLAQVDVEVVLTSSSVTTFNFAVAPTANTYRFIIVG